MLPRVYRISPVAFAERRPIVLDHRAFPTYEKIGANFPQEGFDALNRLAGLPGLDSDFGCDEIFDADG
jgi:hypothetical protein